MLIQCMVSYRENILLLQFNREMNILGPHSALNTSNYAIYNGALLRILPNDTFVESYDNKNIRFKLPYSFLKYLNATNFFRIGYIFRKELKYVESYNGDVYNLCDDIPLGNEVPQYDLVDGYGMLESTNSIIYKYTGKNEIDQIYLEDFYATVNGVIKSPSSINKINDNELLFTFENGIFDIKNIVYLGVYDEPQTNDIYGLPIKGDVLLKIKTLPRPSLKTNSLSTIENNAENRAYLMLMFDERIKDFYADDFAVVYNGKIHPVVYDGNNYGDRTEFEVWTDLKTFLTFPLNPIALFTRVPYDCIRTTNYSNIPINPVAQSISYMFNANSLTWRIPNNNDLKSNEIEIYFDNEIDYGTLITNSNFDNTYFPWDGSILTVPSGAIKFEKGVASDIITLAFNPSFGTITIVPKLGTSFINETITNSDPAIIKAQGNKISIIFSQTENSEAYPMTIDKFKYIGTKLVMSQNQYFLCYGYEPNGVLLLRDIIFVPPMNGVSDNPFKGGYQNPSYIVQVDNNHPYKVYGNMGIKTIIGGFIRVEGALTIGQEVILSNMEILGDIYIKLGNGNLLLDTIDTSNIVYE